MVETTIKQEDFTPAEPNSGKAWLIASAAAIAVLLISVLLMWLLGLFRHPQDDTGAKSLAAAFGLVGAVLSSVVALVGTIIKYSIDDRNARQAALEATRNYTLALQTEQRNRIEAAIRAVDLLSENNRDATASQMGGALLALNNLGELDLAVSLLAQLWPSGKTTAAVADVILRSALGSASTETQASASTVLYQNAQRINQGNYHIWPLPDLSWSTALSDSTRWALARAAGEWLLSDIADRPNFPGSAALVLYQALNDPNPIVSDLAAACLRPLAKALNPDSWSLLGNCRVTVSDISERLVKMSGVSESNEAQDLENRITQFFASRLPLTPTAPES